MLIVLQPRVGARKSIHQERASDEKKVTDKQKRAERKNRITGEYQAKMNEVDAEQQAADEAHEKTKNRHSDAIAKEDENLQNARTQITEVTTQLRKVKEAAETAAAKKAKEAKEQVRGGKRWGNSMLWAEKFPKLQITVDASRGYNAQLQR